MAAPQVAGLPPGLNLGDGYVVRFGAVDPTTGNTVANVTISSATLQVITLTGAPPASIAGGPFLFVGGPEA